MKLSNLRFIEDLLGNLIGEDLRRFSLLQDLILTEREEALEEVLSKGEAHNELLPWELWPIQEACQALHNVSKASQVIYAGGKTCL